MAICLDVFLAADRYDAAGGQDARAVEWPPHPARAFSALRSVAIDADLPILATLECLPPPVVHASPAYTQGRSRAYVVTNTLAVAGGNLNHPGRTSGLRERRSVFPGRPRVQFVWTESGGFGDDAVARLDGLASRVPYLGRSTSVALMSASWITDAAVPDGLSEYRPAGKGSGTVQLRVPYPGYLDELNDLHEQGLSAWQASDGGRARLWYRLVQESAESDDPASSGFSSPYRDLVVLRFVDARPEGRLIPIFAAALRSMVLGQTADPLPPALHGHGFDGNPHVAYLGLPVCGHEHADGRLVGLAVAIPGLDEQERRRVLRGILGPDGTGNVSLRVPGFRNPFVLRYQPDEPRPRTATAGHWAGESRAWVTATPIVLDRYPKNRDLAAAVSQSVVLAGLPEPKSIEVSPAALTRGAVHLSPRELPRRARGRLYCHARLAFDRPLTGPVLVGAGRYFGVGLLQPERAKKEGQGHAS